MVEKCVVFGCSISRNKEKGISMHKIPSDIRGLKSAEEDNDG